MKIIAWNCNMAFDRKRELLLALKPDILILEEISKQDTDDLPAEFKHWVGTNPRKGLAVAAFGNHDCRVSEHYTDELPWFIPLRIVDLDVHVLAVWAHVETPRLRYIRVTHAAIDHYRSFIESAPTIIAGDFNSNKIWDKKHGTDTHTRLIERLDALGLASLHHALNREEQGSERIATWYMYRNREKGYHIDYVFAPRTLISGCSFRIGDPVEWLTLSDHMPLIVDINDSAFSRPRSPELCRPRSSASQ